MHVPFLILVAGDTVLAVLALFGAFLVRFGYVPVTEDILSLNGLIRVSVLVLSLIFVSYVTEIYRLENVSSNRVTFIKILISLILSFLVLSAIYYMMPAVMFGIPRQ